MSRNPEYQFVSTDTESIISDLISAYERTTGVVVHPASPERLFIAWVADVIVQERVLNNYTGNQNLASRAEGENLDALGEQIYNRARPLAQAAYCTVKFYLSEELLAAQVIPEGTRLTDANQSLVWATTEDVYLDIGATEAEAAVQCQTLGIVGNGYAVGQINTLIDVFPYFESCENITESDGGAETSTDEEFYEIMRSSLDSYSTAGALGAYQYYAKQVSNEIADVAINSPDAGAVDIYVLMKDGSPATTEIKSAVYAACNDEHVRPLTDFVNVKDAELYNYDIEFTYYIPTLAAQNTGDIEQAVQRAIDEYVSWQAGQLGKDINPSYLISLLMQTGVKRVELVSPVFTTLRDGGDGTVPQIATVRTITATNGGLES